MAKYQNQFLGTSSYNGDILFWNVNMFKPILNFNASVSPLPLQPKKVWLIGAPPHSLSAVGQDQPGLGGGVGSSPGKEKGRDDFFWRRLGAREVGLVSRLTLI